MQAVVLAVSDRAVDLFNLPLVNRRRILFRRPNPPAERQPDAIEPPVGNPLEVGLTEPGRFPRKHVRELVVARMPEHRAEVEAAPPSTVLRRSGSWPEGIAVV